MVLVNDNDGFRCKNINGQAYSLKGASCCLWVQKKNVFCQKIIKCSLQFWGGDALTPELATTMIVQIWVWVCSDSTSCKPC